MSVIQTVVSTVRNWLKGNKGKREIIVNVEKLETLSSHSAYAKHLRSL